MVLCKVWYNKYIEDFLKMSSKNLEGMRVTFQIKNKKRGGTRKMLTIVACFASTIAGLELFAALILLALTFLTEELGMLIPAAILLVLAIIGAGLAPLTTLSIIFMALQIAAIITLVVLWRKRII